MSDVASLAAERAKRESNARTEVLVAIQRKVLRLLNQGHAPNVVIGGLALALAGAFVRGGVANEDALYMFEEALAFVRLQLAPHAPSADAVDASAPAPEAPLPA